jgi:hypothetical protein
MDNQMKEMIDRLKTNERPLFVLKRDEPELAKALEDLKADVEMLSITDGTSIVGVRGTSVNNDCRIYRLRPDFEFPEPEIVPPEGYRIVSIEERMVTAYPAECDVQYAFRVKPDVWFTPEDTFEWKSDRFYFAVPIDYVFAEDREEERIMFNTVTKEILLEKEYRQHDLDCLEPGWIEITEDERKYLENNPSPVEGFEWVLKAPEKGEEHLSREGYNTTQTPRANMNCIRWTKVPVEKDSFVEYDIEPEADFWRVSVDHLARRVNVDELPGMVGFAGYKFRLSDGTETEWLEDCPCLIEDKPAELIKARFYVGGGE